MRFKVFLGLLAAGFLASWWKNDTRQPEAPPPKEALASPNAALEREYPDLMPEQVAILLLRPEQEALPLARTLEPAGVPFTVLRDTAPAFRHRLVFIPFGDHAVQLNEGLRDAFLTFVSSGGILVLQPPPENPWAWLTGVQSLSTVQTRKKLSFRLLADPAFTRLSEAEQQWFRLGASGPAEGVWTQGLRLLRETDAVPIADFPDTHEVAVARRPLGKGAQRQCPLAQSA